MRKSSMHEPMFYLKDTYKEGYLIKSPPSKMFTSQTSWKTRYFVLSRTHENVFYLDYFKSKEQRSPARGKISLEKIQNISIEPTDHSFWGNIQRMFKASPQNVIRIETKEREYFLIDNNEQSTKEWFEKIKFAYNNMERERNNEVQRDDLDREPQLESNPSPRPSSDPITHEEKDKAFIKLSEEETVDNSVSALKWKPHTLPSDLFNREGNIKENESISVLKWKPHTLSSEFSNSDINIKEVASTYQWNGEVQGFGLSVVYCTFGLLLAFSAESQRAQTAYESLKNVRGDIMKQKKNYEHCLQM
ncbi:pleckstrin homology domain-containing family S member 1 [Protopterus annectens]|uniref:pleckstrin homology domain-containing family S member 1 n=1 Tax=Protopterus annectens TaxID=7888 RepID=UPI001CFA5F4D|nr:pleckstrin homology domain-containing family S member 1 [Protopterus annectens]